ncbi:MAG TPA: hypothetical protein VN154_05350 [Rhizomicrobium sp.]|nr:hypothetical protein [Rhizomicrobium sp.]
MKRLSLIVAVLFVCLVSAPVRAAEALNDAELADVRGGINLGPFANFSFGATMTTSVNGQLALTTTLKLTPQGEQVTQVAGAGTQNLNTSAQYGINVSALPQTGVVVSGSGGGTAIIQSMVSHLLNLVVNTANNQTIVQNTVMRIAVPDLAALKLETAQISIAGALTHSIGLSMLQFAGH